MPLYVESVNMMEGLDDREVHQYFEENPKIIPLFEIDIVDIITPYLGNDENDAPVDDKTLMEAMTSTRSYGKGDASLAASTTFYTEGIKSSRQG